MTLSLGTEDQDLLKIVATTREVVLNHLTDATTERTEDLQLSMTTFLRHQEMILANLLPLLLLTAQIKREIEVFQSLIFNFNANRKRQ